MLETAELFFVAPNAFGEGFDGGAQMTDLEARPDRVRGSWLRIRCSSTTVAEGWSR